MSNSPILYSKMFEDVPYQTRKFDRGLIEPEEVQQQLYNIKDSPSPRAFKEEPKRY